METGKEIKLDCTYKCIEEVWIESEDNGEGYLFKKNHNYRSFHNNSLFINGMDVFIKKDGLKYFEKVADYFLPLSECQ